MTGQDKPKRKYPLTIGRVTAAVNESMFGCGGSPGFCLDCGADADGVEPDAEGYQCAECGAMRVSGAEAILISIGLG